MRHLRLTLIPLALMACKDKGGEDTHDHTGDHTGETGETGDTNTETGETGDTNETGTPDAIEIAGSYTDNWGGDHQIDSETWSQYGGSSAFHISQYDNDADFAIAQNDAANSYNPEMWSRFDWTLDGEGTLWFCQTAYAAATEEDALNTPAADPTDPGTTGCGSFSWTSLIPDE